MGGDHITDALRYQLQHFGVSAKGAADGFLHWGEQFRGLEATGFWVDELEDILHPELAAANSERVQAELEATPGYGTF